MAVSLPHLFIYLSPLELPDLFISPITCTLNFLFKSYDWLSQVSCFYLFIYLVFLFCSIFLFFGFWCSLFRWFYNFVVPKLFSSNVLILVLTSFVFLFILMLYNIRLIRLDIFPVHCTDLG